MQNKRKRSNSNRKCDDQHVSRSFSQLSISQKTTKKKKSSITRSHYSNSSELFNDVNGDGASGRNRNEANKKTIKEKDHKKGSLSLNDIQRFKPRYLRVSDKVFKQMLSNAIQSNDNGSGGRRHIEGEGDGGGGTTEGEGDGGGGNTEGEGDGAATAQRMIQSLDTTEKLQFVRQMTETTNNLSYFDLQRQLWQEYFNMSLKEDASQVATAAAAGRQRRQRLSKADAKQHNTCYLVTYPKHMIEKRQQTIAQQMQRTINELNQYIMQLNTYTTQWQPSIDSNILSSAINTCVKKGQERLKRAFDQKKKMLELNSHDHDLIHKVYDLQPNDEQVCIYQRNNIRDIVLYRYTVICFSLLGTLGKNDMASNCR